MFFPCCSNTLKRLTMTPFQDERGCYQALSNDLKPESEIAGSVPQLCAGSKASFAWYSDFSSQVTSFLEASMRREQDAGAQKGSLHQQSDADGWRMLKQPTQTEVVYVLVCTGRLSNIQSVWYRYAKAMALLTAKEAGNGYWYSHGNGISSL